MRFPPVPNSFPSDQYSFIRDVLNLINNAMGMKKDNDAVSNQLLVASPSKKIFAITVSDAGVVSATLVNE